MIGDRLAADGGYREVFMESFLRALGITFIDLDYLFHFCLFCQLFSLSVAKLVHPLSVRVVLGKFHRRYVLVSRRQG